MNFSITLRCTWLCYGISLLIICLFPSFLKADNINFGGSIISNQIICFGEDPTELLSNASAGGGDASLAIEYLWLQSVPGVYDWTAIENAKGASYDPPPLNQTTAFIRCARRSGFDNYTGESNVILITVLPGPIVIITDAPVGGSFNEPLTFSGLASDPNATLVWDFGDGNTASGQNVMHTFLFGGDKTVTLTATNPNNGCSNSETIEFFLLGPLPVELDYFYGESKEHKVIELIWATQTEENNLHFEIQKAVDGERFETIGLIEGFGNSNQYRDYTFIDDIPFSGINYYRLKQVDYNGDFSFSDIIAIKMEHQIESKFTLYPNPSSDEINIRFKDFNQSDAIVLIKSATNQIVYESVISSQTLKSEFDISTLTSGVYSITIWSKDLRASQLFVKSQL